MNLDDYKDIFEPFDRLIEIEICGEKKLVPENNTLLRCFQYLAIETVSRGDLCWNGDCLNCQAWIEVEGKEKGVVSCRTKVSEGMKITRIHKALDFG